MDHSSREPSTSSISSAMSDINLCNITNNSGPEKDGKIISPPANSSGIVLAASQSIPSPNNLIKERVTCIVKNKERLLGHVYLNGNGTGVYCEYICAASISYKPGDSVYLERSSRRDTFETFNIVKIIDFLRSERDGCLYVRVRGYHRLSEIPASWYPYFQDRDNANNSGLEIAVKEPASSRELVFSDSCECYPVSALRGLSHVRHYRDHHSAKEFEPRPDSFYYIFWKNSYGPSKDKELASTQGEIRVGANFQAKLPACEPRVTSEYMAKENPEEALWQPKACDEFLMYDSSVRSMYAYRNICTSENIQDEYLAAYLHEEEVQIMLDTLHKCDYHCANALHKLLQNLETQCNQPVVQKKFREDETQRFIKGIRKVGKNFFKIQKDFLPQRTTAQLIEFYYLWKKSPNALKTLRRPPNGRRQTGAVVRRMRGRPNRTLSSDYVDLSPSSDEERESDDSEKDLTNYQCSNCSATESKEWHPTTKDKTSVLCSDCRLFYKKYGELRPTEERENSFSFKPIGDEENNENVAVAKNGPTTRRAVGRPKSALAVNSPEAAEKSRRSPGTMSVSSSSSGDQKKKTRGKGNNKTKKETSAESSVISEAPVTPTGRKRRKTSASETPSESSFTECDIAQADDAAIPSATANDRSVGSSPPTAASPTAEIQVNFSSLDVKPHIQASPSTSCLSPKLPIKADLSAENGNGCKLETGTSSSVMIKTEPVAPPVMTKVRVAEDGVKSESPKLVSDKERRRDKENIKFESQEEFAPRSSEGTRFPREQSPEPKPDHTLGWSGLPLTSEKKTPSRALFYRVWSRENNSCARTDYIYVPAPDSPFAQKRAAAMAALSPSKTTKSPAPVKDGKRTPMTSSSQQQPSGERERERDRDNRSVTALTGPHLTETPPRDRNLIQRQTSLPGPSSQQMAESVLGHGPSGSFGGMPQAVYHERMRMIQEMQDRERSMQQFARAGSVPPGMMGGLTPHEAMEMQRRMQQIPGMMGGGMYPGLNAQQAAAANYAAEQAQRDMMMASLMGAGGPHNQAALAAHLHNHPELQHDPAMHFFLSGGGGGPFGPGGPFPGAPHATAEMMHLMGRPSSFEQQQFMAHQQAQAAAAMQQHRMDAEQQHAQAQHLRQMLQMSQIPNFHPDMMR